MYKENYKEEIYNLMESGNLIDAKILLEKELKDVESLMERLNVLTEKAINDNNEESFYAYHTLATRNKANELITEKKNQINQLLENGVLTEEEAVSINNKLDKTLVYTESSIARKLEKLSPSEVFNETKLSLYEKCEKGEITIDEREAMIREAFDHIMSESSDVNASAMASDLGGIKDDTSSNIKNSNNEKELKNAVKDAEKKMDSMTNKADTSLDVKDNVN